MDNDFINRNVVLPIIDNSLAMSLLKSYKTVTIIVIELFSIKIASPNESFKFQLLRNKRMSNKKFLVSKNNLLQLLLYFFNTLSLSK